MGIIQIKMGFGIGLSVSIALRINAALAIVLFAAPLCPSTAVAGEDRTESVPVYEGALKGEDAVSKREVEDSAFVVPPPKILIPVFEKGKWKGYREEPVPIARALSKKPEANDLPTNEMVSPVRRPDGLVGNGENTSVN